MQCIGGTTKSSFENDSEVLREDKTCEVHKKMQNVSYQANPEYAKLTEVVPGLFICGISELNPRNIARNEITLIINATDEVPNLKSLGNIPRIKLWIDDTPETDVYPHFDVLSDQIEAVIASGGAVLVHCVAGVSRSATICLAFLTKYRCPSLRDAYFLMASKRPLVRPNIGFWRQLIQFEEEIKHGQASVRIIHDEVLGNSLLPDVYREQGACLNGIISALKHMADEELQISN